MVNRKTVDEVIKKIRALEKKHNDSNLVLTVANIVDDLSGIYLLSKKRSADTSILNLVKEEIGSVTPKKINSAEKKQTRSLIITSKKSQSEKKSGNQKKQNK